MMWTRRGATWWVAAAGVLSVAILALAVGCGQAASPQGDADISGTATAVTHADADTWSFLVTGSGAYDKASVTATSDTAWYYRSSGGEVTSIDAPASAADLEGRRVDVQFTGPVAESYPVQAGAAWVVVFD